MSLPTLPRLVATHKHISSIYYMYFVYTVMMYNYDVEV